MQQLRLGRRRRSVDHLRRQPALLVRHQTIGATQEAVHAPRTVRLPRLGCLERPHVHLVQPQRVCPELCNHIVRIDDVEARLRHLLHLHLQRRAIGLREGLAVAQLRLLGVEVAPRLILVGEGQDHPLIEQPLEGLPRRDQPAIVEHLVPEPRVQQVKHRMLRATHIEVDRHPVPLLLGVDKSRLVVRVDVAQVVPAGASPLRHRVRLAHRIKSRLRVGRMQPLLGTRQRRLAILGRPVGVDVGQRQRQQVERQRLHLPVARVDQREGLAPVTLTAEQPVPQLVVHPPLADAPLLEPPEHLLLRSIDAEPIEEARIHKLAVAGVGRRRHISARNDLENRKRELTGKLPVPLVMSWHRHDRARAVAREHIVGDPDRQPRTVHRVRRKSPREDTRLLLRLLGPVELRLPRCGQHVGLHRRTLLLRDDA